MKTAEDLEAAPISFKVSKILSFGTLALITAIRTIVFTWFAKSITSLL